MEKVSIIIPVFRTEEWLEECVKSCLAQTYPKVEIILVDDGSPDQSGEICDRLAKEYVNIIVVHQKNGGVSSARNKGIERATGDFVIFVDSDDTIHPQMVECLISRQKLNNLDLTICGYNAVFHDKTIPAVCHTAIDARTNLDCMWYLADRTTFGEFRSACGKLFKLSIIQNNSILFRQDLKYGEDFCFVMDYLSHCESVFYLNKALYNYRQETFDKSDHYQRKDVIYQWANGFDLHKHFREVFIKTNTYPQLKALVDSYILYRIKQFMNDMVSAGVRRDSILLILRQIRYSEFYPDLINIKFRYVNDLLEKAVLFCVRCHLWPLLYSVFFIKVFLFNKQK